MEALRDIKGLEKIEDYSLYLLILAGVLFLLLVWTLFKYWNKKKILSPKEIALSHLNALDFNDAKACAYAISQWGIYLCEEAKKEEFEKLLKNFEKYKYKKETPPFIQEDKDLLRAFLGKKDV
ncbi:MAG: hypothetical protein J0647_07865 [Campylobacteraceae bacterium]|nr:hypothetical protein [Campylobacteraceae bacterium]